MPFSEGLLPLHQCTSTMADLQRRELGLFRKRVEVRIIGSHYSILRSVPEVVKEIVFWTIQFNYQLEFFRRLVLLSTFTYILVKIPINNFFGTNYMGELESEIICTFEKIVEPQELNCFLHTCGCERCNMFNCTSDLNVCNNAQSLLSAIIFRNKRFNGLCLLKC